MMIGCGGAEGEPDQLSFAAVLFGCDRAGEEEEIDAFLAGMGNDKRWWEHRVPGDLRGSVARSGPLEMEIEVEAETILSSCTNV